MKKILIFTSVLFFFLTAVPVFAAGQPSTCEGTPVSFPSVEKRFVPLGGGYGRPGDCVIPTKIIMHTTISSMNEDDTYAYFASGSEGRGVNTHFIIGNTGKVIQTVETLQKTVEVSYGIAGYNQEAISIELTYNGVYHDKLSVPTLQYAAAQNLVTALMKQYNIPLSNLGYDWKSTSDAHNAQSGAGIFGHYQLNPETRQDPGVEFLKAFLVDLKSGVTTSSAPTTNTANGSGQSDCVVTKVGNPTGAPILPSTCSSSATTGDGSPRGQKPPNYPSDLAGAIKDQFGITIVGFENDSDFMKWIWEKLWDIKGTKFSSLIKGAIVKRDNDGISQQVGCPGKKNIYGGDESVRLNAYPYGEAFFKYIFTHELGHVIHNCSAREVIRWGDMITQAQAEGAVSFYGANAASCTDSDNNAENYADAVAYYLNPEAGIATASCGGRAPNAPPNPFFGTPVLKPGQFAIMKTVLN